MVDDLEHRWTLTTAVARYEQLRNRDALVDRHAPAGDPAAGRPLGRDEALEMLALGEVIARKAGYGRQLAVRTARAAGASWAAIGQALGTSRQAAWEAHTRWIDAQVREHEATGYTGLDETQATEARALAGAEDDEAPR